MISTAGAPPTGVDPAETDRRWRSRWGERIPTTARIVGRWGDNAEAVRVLPEPRRYPSEDGDYDLLVAKVVAVTQAVLGSPVVLVLRSAKEDPRLADRQCRSPGPELLRGRPQSRRPVLAHG